MTLRIAEAAQIRKLAEDADFTAAAFLDLYARTIHARRAA